MAIALSTAGMNFSYGVETTANTMPTSFKIIEGAMSLPEMNPTPEAIDVTPLSEKNFKQYIEGLKDIGGGLGINFSHNDDFMAAWDEFVEAYKTAAASGKATWAQFYHPELEKSFCFRCQPSELGFGGAEVNSHLQATAYVIPLSNVGWKTKVVPTTTAS